MGKPLILQNMPGVALSLDSYGALHFDSEKPLTDEQLAWLRSHKAQIVAALSAGAANQSTSAAENLPRRIMAVLRGGVDPTLERPAGRFPLEELAARLGADATDTALAVCELERGGAVAVEYDADGGEWITWGYLEYYRASAVAKTQQRPAEARKRAWG